MNLIELVIFMAVTSSLGASIAIAVKYLTHGSMSLYQAGLCGALVGPVAVATVITIWASTRRTRQDDVGRGAAPAKCDKK